MAAKTNNIVSMRLPGAMLERLKDQTKDDLYVDVSEAIRDIIRQKYLDSKSGVSKPDTNEKLFEELKKIHKLLEGGRD